MERSAPDNLLGVACGVLKPSAEQQGVQEQRQDALSVAQDDERSLGSPRMLHGHLHQLHASSISHLLVGVC